jgi:hypothetical protein
MVTQQEIDELNAKGAERDLKEPRFASAKCEGGRVTLELKGSAFAGATLSFDARQLTYLAQATNEQLAQVELTANGDALHFPALDEHIAAPGLVEAVTGLKTTRAIGAKGGSSTSEAKRAAVRANGAKGGRPRKNPAA